MIDAEVGAKPVPYDVDFACDEDAHIYWLDGERVVSVTEVLGVLSKPGLLHWAPRVVSRFVAEKPAEVDRLRALGHDRLVEILGDMPRKERDRAAKRGTRVHEMAESLAVGEKVILEAFDEMEDDPRPFAHAAVDFLDQSQAEIVGAEMPNITVDPQVCGKADLIADVMIDGRKVRALIDWKTSTTIDPSVAWQLAAYAGSDLIRVKGEWFETRDLGIETCIIIHLLPDGTWQAIETELDAAVVAQFHQIVHMHEIVSHKDQLTKKITHRIGAAA